MRQEEWDKMLLFGKEMPTEGKHDQRQQECLQADSVSVTISLQGLGGGGSKTQITSDKDVFKN